MAGLLKKFQHAPAGEKAEEGEEGESLTTILTTPEDRAALTVLIVQCTESMRQALLDVFDAEETGKESDLLASLGDTEDAGKQIVEDSKDDLEKQRQAVTNTSQLSEPKPGGGGARR